MGLGIRCATYLVIILVCIVSVARKLQNVSIDCLEMKVLTSSEYEQSLESSSMKVSGDWRKLEYATFSKFHEDY